MDKETRKTVKWIAKKLKQKYRLERLVLFGSRARGDNFIHSDYDFIVVSNDFKGKRFDERMAEVHGLWNKKEFIEPLCYTPEEFKEKKKTGIIRKALMEGIEIA
ncbi:MAG: nucleotidyltransferase domain-containing protein [Candidatus Diapherotrites archaeon]